MRWRRWGRRHYGQVLTLGDVRALIIHVDALGLRTDTYTDADGEHALQVGVLTIPHAPRHLVYRIFAEPQHTPEGKS